VKVPEQWGDVVVPPGREELSCPEIVCPGNVLSGNRLSRKRLVRRTSVRESDCPGNDRTPIHLAVLTPPVVKDNDKLIAWVN